MTSDPSSEPNPPNDPGAELISAFLAATRGELASDKLMALATDQGLASRSTPESAYRLAAYVAEETSSFGVNANPFAQMIEQYARTLDTIRHCGESLTLYNALMPVVRENASEMALACCLNHRAIVLKNLGHYVEALEGHEAAAQLYEAQNSEFEAAQCRMNRANVLQFLCRYQEALEEYGRALEVYERGHWDLSFAQCRMNRAGVYQLLGEFQTALKEYQEVLQVYDHAGLVLQTAQCRENLANALRLLNQYQEALSAYEATLTVYQDLGLRSEEARCRMNRAGVLQLLGHLDEATAEFEGIDPVFFSPIDTQRLHANIGRILWTVGRREQALLRFNLGREALRTARGNNAVDFSNLEFIAEQSTFVDLCVDCALELDRRPDAFAAMQDGKASLFGDLRKFARRIYSDTPEVQPSRQHLAEWMRSPPDGLPPEEWHTEYRQRSEEFFRVWRIAQHQVRQAGELTAPEDGDIVFTLEQIQQHLASDWAILDFWRTENERFVVFVVTRHEFHLEYVNFPISDSSFEHALTGLWQLTRKPSASANAEALYDLDAHLFAPLRPYLHERGIKGLYLVPHGILQSLPLHAAARLVDGHPAYLGDEFAIAYLPSSALLPQLPPVALNGQVLSLANPERGHPKLTLPFADWEGRELRRRLGLPVDRCFAGPDATYERTSLWEDAGLVHFSGHGQGDPLFAPLSHLRLADDLLLAHDVVYRRPPLRDGSLVVLNGCQTAVRDERAVDENMGLMSAFLLRGASLVLATQWSVEDQCAAELALTFIEQMWQGTAPTDSLKIAQNRVRTMTSAEILKRYQQVIQELKDAESTLEQAEVCQTAAAWAIEAGEGDMAREFAAVGAESFRRVGHGAEAERLAELLRGPAAIKTGKKSFDKPVYWAAFQLVGRVV